MSPVRRMDFKKEDMAKRKKQTPKTGVDKVSEAPVSFEEFKRREHEQALEDFRHAVTHFEIQERVAKSIVRQTLAEGEILGRQKAEHTKSVLASNIKRLREECGWTVDELSDKVGLDRRTVLRHTQDRAARPRLRTLKYYAEAFTKQLGREITVSDLLYKVIHATRTPPPRH